MMSDSYQIYFGGDLFDHKDLIGNELLATYIEKCSQGRYQVYLPQNMEQKDATALDIRNQDLKMVLECDLALFMFDGTELDAGAVAEFMVAKFLDIPSVIMRSDFRSSGEADVGGDDWNLMCSFYPRTEAVQFSSIILYQEEMLENISLQDGMERLYTRIAAMIIEKLDLVRKASPVFQGDRSQLEALYRWALTFPAGALDSLLADASYVEKMIDSKLKKKLITISEFI
jgi:nucleoside 2-deoxyribosyltransferase